MKILSKLGLLTIALSFALVSPASAQASTFFDDFNDGNIDGWASLPQGTWYGLGNWRIVDGVLTEDAGRDHYKLLAEDHALSDQSVESKILFHNNGYAGITVWHHDVNNWVDVLIYPGAGIIRVVESIDGVLNRYDYPLTTSQATWYTMRVDADSSSGELAVYLDDARVVTHTVATANKTGLSGLNSGNGGGSFDDFSLTDDDVDIRDVLGEIIALAKQAKKDKLIKGYERANLTRPAKHALRDLRIYERRLKQEREEAAQDRYESFLENLDKIDEALDEIAERPGREEFIDKVKALFDDLA